MQRGVDAHDRPLHRRGRGADDRRPHHQGPARRGRRRRHRRRVRVGRRERRDVLREPRRPATGPTRLHAYLTLQAGTNVYLFHEDATAARRGRQPRQLHVHRRTPSTRIDGQYIDTSQPIFSYYDADGNPIPTPITTPPSLRSIDSVGINLRVRVHADCADRRDQHARARPQRRLQPEHLSRWSQIIARRVRIEPTATVATRPGSR